MINIFGFLKNTIEDSPLPKSKYDFVEQYELVVDLKFLKNHTLWKRNSYIPIEYTNKKENTIWTPMVYVPAAAFYKYIKWFATLPEHERRKKSLRTVSIINMKNRETMFIFPAFNKGEKPYAYFNDKTLPFNVTPEINRAISEQFKLHTR